MAYEMDAVGRHASSVRRRLAGDPARAAYLAGAGARAYRVRQEFTVTLSVEILEVPQRWLAAVAFTCAPEDFATTVGETLGRIGEALIEASVDLGEIAIVTYRRTDAGFEGAVGYEVDGEFAPQGVIVPFALPPGEVGCVTYAEGDTEDPLADLEIGVLAEGRELAEDSPLWEEHRATETAIFWPLAPAG